MIVKDQWQRVPPVTTADLAGKTVVVTGANAGIGYEAAKHFATMNPGKLILACRNKDRGNAAVAKLKEETGLSRIELRTLNLSSFASVVEFCNALQSEEERLDIFVANAAITSKYALTDDGWESTLQVNNLSTLLCSILLAPFMARTFERHPESRPRIVVVGSSVHYLASLPSEIADAGNPLKVLSSREYCTPQVMEQRYTDSKLIALFMTRALAKILRNSPVIVNCVDPGYCRTEIQSEARGLQWLVFPILDRYLAWTAEEGSRQLVWAALSLEDSIDDMHGAYIARMAVTEASDYVIGSEGMLHEQKIWGNLVDELTKFDPCVPEILKELSSSGNA
ncbi:NAD(P)-binding protein [Coprinopsis marcescibilis]|uniref:NAD(P)-binding protein n=1 Tax=Coprinopsis marcescibilis TaxID=230819 RepID=A0A5C3KT77_COPMA|nr:NAD(P)-binding protein [Coprinopsis marcescibilis]